MANVFTFITDNLNNNKKASTKTTKTKPSTLSSKITINKNTTAQSIRDNLNKSSVSNPLETSTPTTKSNYVKQNVVNVKTNKVADNLNKSSVSDPLATSYQPTTKKTDNNNTNANKVNNNSVSNPLENSYNQQEYTISDEQAKKDRQQIVRTASNIFTKALNTANENSWNEQDQHKLDVMYNAKVDTTSVDDKIKADSTYYNNLVDSNGNFIDYDGQILELEEKKKNTFYTQEIKNYDEQIKQLKTYQQDIKILKRSANYDYLVKNGASQDQLNEYKKYVIRDDYNGIERAIANFGSTIQGYVGNSLKGADTLMALANQLVGNDDYESSEYANKIIEQAGTLQQQVFSNASSAEKVVYELYNSQANYLYALATAYMGGQLLSGMGSLLGATSAAQNLNSTALLLSDVSVLGSAMHNNEQMGYSKEDSLNNAILKACISHFTEKIGGDNIADIVTGKIGQKMLANGVEYMKKSIINSMISEGSEEFAEALLEPIADKLTTEKGITVEDYLNRVCSTDTVYQVFMGAVGGGIAGGVFSANTLVNFNRQVNAYASQLNIESKADYNTAKEALAKFNELIEEGKVEIDKAKAEGQDTTLDDMQLVNCVALSKAYSKVIADYEQRNPYRDLVNKESDKSKAEFSQDAMKEIINDTRPDLDNALGTIDKLNQEVKEQQLKASTLITEEAINEVANEKQNNTDITQENITPNENENIVNPSVEMAENGSNDILMDMQEGNENVPSTENNIETEINNSMSMKDVKNMLDRAFETYLKNDKYLNPHRTLTLDEYLQSDEDAVGELATFIENDEALYNSYIKDIKGIINEDFDLKDVIYAYKNRTLKNFGVDNFRTFNMSNRTNGEEKLTADELEQIIKQTNWNDKGVTDNQAQLEKMERAKKILTEQASKKIKGYDTLRAEFPGLSKDVFNRAVYEVDIYGDLTDATANQVADELSLELSIDGVINGRNTAKEFVREALETFANEVKYKTGETNRARTRKAIKENIAYKSLDSDIEGTYNELAKGESLDKRSARIKKAYQLKYQSSVENLVKANEKLMTLKGKKIDSGVSVNKTIDQNIFALGHGDSKIYNDLKQKIRYECLNVAAETRESILNEAQEVINKVKKLGITAGTKEDIALQYILEGHTEKYRTDIDIKSKNINQETIDAYWRNPWQEYTLDDLKKEFDYKASNGKQMWENIVEASTIIREAYDNIIDRINRTQIDANGDIEGAEDVKTIQLLVKVNEAYESMQKIKEEIKKNGSTPSTQAAYEIEKQRYNKLSTQYNTRISRAESGELTRRNLTPYRKNYSHHIIKKNVIDRVNDIINAEYSIPTELAGVSDYTQPNTAFSSFSLAQNGGKYTPTALESYAEYMREASNVVAYNPVILELRQFNKDIKASTKGNTLNKLSEYLNDYCNMLAGKRNPLDKGFEKIIGTKAMKTISTLNQYAKQAAVTGNFRSGLIQFANIPNGIAILQSKGGKETITDIANGMKSYVLSTKDGEATAIDMSAYLANRYFDFDLGKKGLGTTVKEITDSILRIGDEVGAKIIWWSAYEQGKRLNVDNANQYADDITRSATGGRTKEDMAITMNSQVVNLLLPFQLENNNVFQTLKQHAQNKNVGALATYGVSAYIFNMIIKFITGGDDEALAEFVTPIVEEIKNAVTGEKKVDEAINDMFWGEIAEFISIIPGGDQILQLAIDSDVGDEIFGEYNPSRYGSTNIGLAGIGKTFKALNNDNPKVALANATSQLVGGYVPGGKQITRTVGGLQSMGGLPKLNSNGNVEISPTNYTSSGKVSWINDQSNVFDWIKATMFGKYNTSEARKYYDNGATPLGTKDTRIFDTLGGEYEDYAIVTNDDMSLREQLLASGQYDDYKKNVENLYADYLENWNEDADGDMKTWKEFAKMYGLSSDDLKQDVYDDFYESYNISEEAQKQFAEAIKIENVKDENGKTIANSGAVQRRIAYEQSGIYEQIIKYIKTNDLEYSDFGLNKSVVENFDEDDINRVLAKIGKGEYKSSTDDEKAKDDTSKSAKSKSSKSSKTVVGSQISSNTSTTKSKTNYSTTNDYDNAYSSIMSSVKSGGKKNYGQSSSKSSGGSETTCPNCGSVVVPINGRCPRCGASL